MIGNSHFNDPARVTLINLFHLVSRTLGPAEDLDSSQVRLCRNGRIKREQNLVPGNNVTSWFSRISQLTALNEAKMADVVSRLIAPLHRNGVLPLGRQQ